MRAQAAPAKGNPPGTRTVPGSRNRRYRGEVESDAAAAGDDTHAEVAEQLGDDGTV